MEHTIYFLQCKVHYIYYPFNTQVKHYVTSSFLPYGEFTTMIVVFILPTTITQSYEHSYDTYLRKYHTIWYWHFYYWYLFRLFQNQKIKNTSIFNFNLTCNTYFHWLLFTVKFNCHMHFLIGWNLRCPLCTNKISF